MLATTGVIFAVVIVLLGLRDIVVLDQTTKRLQLGWSMILLSFSYVVWSFGSGKQLGDANAYSLAIFWILPPLAIWNTCLGYRNAKMLTELAISETEGTASYQSLFQSVITTGLTWGATTALVTSWYLLYFLQ
jgi:hypothetical protein